MLCARQTKSYARHYFFFLIVACPEYTTAKKMYYQAQKINYGFENNIYLFIKNHEMVNVSEKMFWS